MEHTEQLERVRAENEKLRAALGNCAVVLRAQRAELGTLGLYVLAEVEGLVSQAAR